jgi:replication factor A1
VGGILGKPNTLDVHSIENGGNSGGGGGGGPSYGSKPAQQHHSMMNQPRPPLTSNQPRPQPTFNSAPPQFSAANMGGMGGQQRTPPKSFYGNTPAYTPKGMSNSGLTSSPSQLSERRIVPIDSLNPYQNKWTIKARVISRPNLRTYSNARGEGRVMSVELVDQSGEIRASAFNETADKLSTIFQANKIFYVSKGRIKPANKQFSNCNSDYEITFGQETEVEECFEDASNLPTASFNFTPIDHLETLPKDTIVDVIGVCNSVGDLTSVTVRTTNKQISKRDIVLLDKSGKSITCTLWGAEAEGFEATANPIIAIKGARLSDFNGVSLNSLMSSNVFYNPEIPQCYELRGWYDRHGKDITATSLSGQSSFAGGTQTYLTYTQIKQLNLGCQDKPDYFRTKGMIGFVKKDNCLYKACSSADCKKKVTDDGSGNYFCEKCNRSSPDFKYNIILQLKTMDYLDHCWMNCFTDTATKVLGVDAQALGELREENEAEYDQVMQQAYFKDFTFVVRAKVETYNDEQRVKYSCVDAIPIAYDKESRRLLESIKEMMTS